MRSIGLLGIGFVVGAASFFAAPHLSRPGDNKRLPNLVMVTDRVHTSGQPSAAQLRGLKQNGYDLIINLAPSSGGSIPEEGKLIAEAGGHYVGIPVREYHPTYDDFAFFSSVVTHSGAKRILVHCQTNVRASIFAFLYRVVHEGVAPSAAYEKALEMSVPDPHWRVFAKEVLAKHAIEFDPEIDP